MNTDSYDPLDGIAIYFDNCDSLLNGFDNYVNTSKLHFTIIYNRIINTTHSSGLKWPLPQSYFNMTNECDWENFMLPLIFVKDDQNKSKNTFDFIDKNNDTVISLEGKTHAIYINCSYVCIFRIDQFQISSYFLFVKNKVNV